MVSCFQSARKQGIERINTNVFLLVGRDMEGSVMSVRKKMVLSFSGLFALILLLVSAGGYIFVKE